MEKLIETQRLEAVLKKFSRDRDWEQYHSPKNLAMALTAEVGELVEIFQWLTEEESKGVANNPQTAKAVRDEIADVILYLVQLASVLDVDINEAVTSKITANTKKYPPGDSTPTR